MTPPSQRLVKRLPLALAAVAFATFVAAAWLAPFDDAAKRQVDAGLERALLSFASARAIDAVISALQGTEVAVQPAGVGVIFSPGEALDPVNDLVEQFADLMLTACVAFGAQKLLLAITAHAAVSLALSIVALAWLIWQISAGPAPGWLSRLLLMTVMLRFALPLTVIGSNALFEHFMAADYQTSQQAIASSPRQIDALAGQSEAAQPGVAERLRQWAAQPGEIKARYAQLKDAAEQLVERVVRLIVIFLLQTLVFPLFLLWMLWSVLRRLLEPRAGRRQ